MEPTSNKFQMVVRGSEHDLVGHFQFDGTFNGDWTQIPGAIISPPALVWNLIEQ